MEVFGIGIIIVVVVGVSLAGLLLGGIWLLMESLKEKVGGEYFLVIIMALTIGGVLFWYFSSH